MKKFLFFPLICILILSISCNKLENETRSNSLLIIKSIKAINWQEEEADVLFSDVIVEKEDSVYVQADLAVVELTAELLNPTPGIEPSIYNNIMVDRYIVHFKRSDGKNTPGVDVPYPIEGNLSVLVEIGRSVKVSFVIVTINAKREPPLVNLVEGNEPEIKATAIIDLYGHDLANNKVKATGYLQVFFSNYLNE
jgi:hypothetical protein